jgi:hypothetical protein
MLIRAHRHSGEGGDIQGVPALWVHFVTKEGQKEGVVLLMVVLVDAVRFKTVCVSLRGWINTCCHSGPGGGVGSGREALSFLVQ